MVDLLKNGVRPAGILATTFTKKAAAELQERVRVRLLEAGMTEAANELGSALIGTVHSIGTRLLQRFAFAPALDQFAHGLLFGGLQGALKIQIQLEARHLQYMRQQEFRLQAWRLHLLALQELSAALYGFQNGHGESLGIYRGKQRKIESIPISVIFSKANFWGICYFARVTQVALEILIVFLLLVANGRYAAELEMAAR